MVRANLKVRPAKGKSFEVPIAGTATIGRSRTNLVSLDFSPEVSRQHAVVRCLDDLRYQIMDLGSRNGTFVNDRQVITPVILSDGDVIGITDNEIYFEQVGSSEPTPMMGDRTLSTSTGVTHEYSATVAVMVCDIRGFSTMSEILPPRELARTLGEWFRVAGDLVHQTGGTIDKFIGDAVLAYWAPGNEPGREARNAFATGLKLLDQSSRRCWCGDASKPFSIAVALHHGAVTCRNIGFVAQRDATIIGDTVNTVFRIESVMKGLGQKLAVSEEVVAFLEPTTPALNALGFHHLKGKNQPVRLFGMNA